MLNVDSIQPGVVNILIGSNGSGKSRLLRTLSIDFLRHGVEVLAIAPTIYDRFRRMPLRRGFHFFGARNGLAASVAVIRSAIARASADKPQILKNLNRALQYTKFSPFIGIQVSDINLENFDHAVAELSNDEARALYSALIKWKNRSDSSAPVRLQVDTFSFEELNSLDYATVAEFDAILRKNRIVSRIEYFLYRDYQEIPLTEACSGEISFITTIAFIATAIEYQSVIAVDEPETSLHPTWQRDYVQTLLDLFYQYEPRIVISTHSPIVISGAEARREDTINSNIVVHEMRGGEAHLFVHQQLSLEEMYSRLFDLITPKNHYLSQQAVRILNSLDAGEESLDQSISKLRNLRTKSYDETQRQAIGSFEEMARKLAATKHR